MTNEKKYRIGIDLGGTNIKVGIVDQQHKIIAHHSVKTLVERNYTEIIKDMADAVYHVLEQWCSGICRKFTLGTRANITGIEKIY